MDNSLLQQFILETRDLIDEAGRGILDLERSSGDPEIVNGIFRALHTIKGTSGIFPEFSPVTTLTHAAEDLMAQVRKGARALDPVSVDLLLATLDMVGGWIDSIDGGGTLPDGAATSGLGLRDRLVACLGKVDEEAAPAPTKEVPPEAVERAERLDSWLRSKEQTGIDALLAPERGPLVAFRYEPTDGCFFFGDDPVNTLRGVDGLESVETSFPGGIPSSLSEYDPFQCLCVFNGIARGTVDRVALAFRYVDDQVALRPIDASLLSAPSPAAAPAPVTAPAPVEMIDMGEAPPQAAQAVVPAAGEPAVATVGAPVSGRAVGKAGVRVDQEVINQLMDLVGELMIAKNVLPFLCRRAAYDYGVPVLAAELDTHSNSIAFLVESLQNVAMEMRMMPVGRAFERFPRLVRDITRKIGKKVELKVEGEDARADKDVIEAIAEPLVHLVRNSLDHGFESPEDRIEAGKPEIGTLLLRASQEAGSIVIEIVDDGRGIDAERVRTKAAEKGLMTAEALAAMPDDQVVMLVMAPDFSTADKVSDLSGRGVGMDAVQSMVKRFGGSIKLTTEKGSGTTVRLALPLSMAITSILVVNQGECTFGIPGKDVVETLGDLPLSRITTVGGSPGLEVRGNLVPLYDLGERLATDGVRSAGIHERFSAVVVRIDGGQVALAVDGFRDIMDAVVKPLSGLMSRFPHYSGSTILGDGSILFMLDLREVVRDAGQAN